MNIPKRIMILGSAGSGKSTLAMTLGRLTGIPVVHLDRFFWNPGWVQTPDEEMTKRVTEAAEKEQWIIDGNYSKTLDIRLERADCVVFIDFNRFFCLYRVFKRRIRYAGKFRYDVGEGCEEKIDKEFLTWVWNYPKRIRPKILEKISQYCNGENYKNFYRFTKRRQIEQFLKETEARMLSSGEKNATIH